MAKRKGNRNDRSRRPRPAGTGGTIWLYGVHAVAAALANPARARHRLVATADGAERLAGAHDAPEIVAGATEIVERRALDELLPAGAVHQGLALLTAPLPAPAIEDITDRGAAAARAAVIVLDRVSDPHNVGAVVRSAAVFGALAVVVPDRHSPGAGGVLAKSASGGLETEPLVRVANLARALHGLKECGFWCVGLDSAATTRLDRADLPDRVAFVLGAEGSGLRRLTRETCDLTTTISGAGPDAGPGAGTMASLNVSCAATVALYAFARAA